MLVLDSVTLTLHNLRMSKYTLFKLCNMDYVRLCGDDQP